MSRLHEHYCPACEEWDACDDPDCMLPTTVLHAVCEVASLEGPVEPAEERS